MKRTFRTIFLEDDEEFISLVRELRATGPEKLMASEKVAEYFSNRFAEFAELYDLSPEECNNAINAVKLDYGPYGLAGQLIDCRK